MLTEQELLEQAGLNSWPWDDDSSPKASGEPKGSGTSTTEETEVPADTSSSGGMTYKELMATKLDLDSEGNPIQPETASESLEGETDREKWMRLNPQDPSGPAPSLQGSGVYDGLNSMFQNGYGDIAGSVGLMGFLKSPNPLISASGAGLGSAAEDAWLGEDVNLWDVAKAAAWDLAANGVVRGAQLTGGWLNDIPAVNQVTTAMGNSKTGQAISDAAQKYVGDPVSNFMAYDKPNASPLQPDDIANTRGVPRTDPAVRSPETGRMQSANPAPEPPMMDQPQRPPLVRAGEDQSLRDSNTFLNDYADRYPDDPQRNLAGLTSRQLGAKGATKFADSMNEQSYFSADKVKRRNDANNSAIEEEIVDINRGPVLMDETEQVGSQVQKTIDAGNAANKADYQAGVNEIAEILGPDASIKPMTLIKNLREFQAKIRGRNKNTGKLDPSVNAEIEQFVRDLAEVNVGRQEALKHNRLYPDEPPKEIPTYNVQDLTEKMQMLNAAAKKATEPGAVQSTATTQLYALRSYVAEYTEQQIRKLSPKAADKYLSMNKEYGETVEELFAPINKTTTGTAVDKGSVEGITGVFNPQASPDALRGYQRTVKRAYAKVKPDADGVKRINNKTLAETEAAMQREYTTQLFNGGNASTSQEMTAIAIQFKTIKAQRSARAALDPETFDRVNKLMNLIVDSRLEGPDEVMGLIFNNAQTTASKNVATGGILKQGAAAVIGGMKIFGWAATKRSTTNKLMAALGRDVSNLEGPALNRALATSVKLLEELREEYNADPANEDKI